MMKRHSVLIAPYGCTTVMINGSRTIHPDDTSNNKVHTVVSNHPEMEVIELVEEIPEDVFINGILWNYDTSELRAWLIGGAARSMHTSEPINDYDIVFGNQESLVTFRKMLKKAGAIIVSVTEAPDADIVIGEDYSYGGKIVQLKFSRFYDRVDDQLDNADFTVCQFFLALGRVDPGEYKFGCSAQGLIDSKMKVLRLHKLSQPAATIARITKFINKGYVPLSNVSFFKPLVEEIRAMPYDARNFEPIRKRSIVRVR